MSRDMGAARPASAAWPAILLECCMLLLLGGCSVYGEAAGAGAAVVPAAAVEEACGAQMRSWRGSILQPASEQSPASSNDATGSSWAAGGSFLIGEWRNPAVGSGDQQQQLVSGEKGFFDMVSPQPLDHTPSTALNVSGSAYLAGTASSSVDVRALAGVFNSASGHICLAACARHQNSTDCEIRVNVTLEYPRLKFMSTKVTGTIESLRGEGDPLYFGVLEVHAVKKSVKQQHALYMATLGVKFAVIFVELVLVLAQIYRAVKSGADACYISTLGLTAQVAILGFRWGRALYLPLRYLKRRMSYKFLVRTWKWTTPLISDFFLIGAYVALALVVVLKRRRMGHKGAHIKAHELPLWLFGLPLYLVIGLVLWWWTHGLQTYLQVVLFWWLLPQIVANVMWDLRTQPLSRLFIVGVSLCRFVILTFDTFRPTIYGYDDIYNFPRNWYWGVSLSLILFVVTVWTQQAYGGRWFIPKRLYGYQQIELTTNSNFKLEIAENEV